MRRIGRVSTATSFSVFPSRRDIMEKPMRGIILFLLMMPFAQAQTPNTPKRDIEGTLKELARTWDEAMVKRDINTLDRLLADDYIISGTTKPQYLALIKSSEIKYTSVARESTTVRIYGDTALMFGRMNLDGESRAIGGFSSSFSFMDVWVKQQQTWRCVATKAEEIIQTYQKQQNIRVGPDVRASLVIVFKPGVTNEQVNNFMRNVLQNWDPNEQRHRNIDGILSVLRVPPIEGHEAIAVSLHEDIMKSQKESIKSKVSSPPIVQRIFEDIAPTDIKLN